MNVFKTFIYFFIFLSSSTFATKNVIFSDKVYFRLGSDFYSGHKIIKVLDKLSFLQCLSEGSPVFTLLEKSINKKKTIRSLIKLSQKIKSSKRYDSIDRSFIDLIMNAIALEKSSQRVSVNLSVPGFKKLQKQTQVKHCPGVNYDEEEKRKLGMSLLRQEKFIKSRFRNLGNSNELVSFENLKGQYEVEFFY